MIRIETRLARLEAAHVRRRWEPAPWEPPTPEEVATRLAPVLAIYEECGLLEGPALDEAGILAACRGMDWPRPTDKPASIQYWGLMQAVLRRCGMRQGDAAGTDREAGSAYGSEGTGGSARTTRCAAGLKCCRGGRGVKRAAAPTDNVTCRSL